ncbi:alanine-zipper protein [Nostoc sp.]|uniref:alanine-zipper protein n=1 Tax=Nostoc sp. TaxID=1180 RepID=UPI002FFC40EE
MSASSTIGNLKSALGCASKCDCCEKLQAQINALKVQLAAIDGKYIPRTNEAAIINTAKIQAKDLILPLVISYVLGQLKPIRELITGLENTLFKLSGQITNILGKLTALELTIANALKTAANALGISNQALKAIGELFAKLAPLLSILGTILSLVETIATLETLGSRIDAVERGLEALGASVSGILGKLLGLQNRISRNESTIAEVRGIAIDARGIGEAANLRAGSAYVLAGNAQTTAVSASSKASQAQTTADGAVKNAAIANENATTAYNKAVEAQATANTATTKANEATKLANTASSKAGEAFGKAVEALGVALTALALFQTFKGLKGLKGDKGDRGERGFAGAQGIQGPAGRDGLNGAPGANGIPGTVGPTGRPGVSGMPGRNGAPGRQGNPGIAGRNGKDVNPADLASLRGLIIQQHAATRANINATTTGLFGKIQAFIAAGNAALTALVTAIATNTYVEKAMQLLTLAATLHNAAMLSNNLAQTLGTIINQCVGLILPKGINGQPINITEVLGHAIEDLVKDAIGTDNYTTITTDWAKANRIYQAGSNVFNQVSNAVGILTSGLEMIGGNIGKIGNALKIWGVVGQHAYAFMNPQPNMKGKFFDFINTASAEANTIQMMVAIPVAFSAAAIAVNESTDAFSKALDQTDPVDAHGNPIHNADGSVKRYEPGVTVPDPTKTILAQEQAKADSTNIIEATIDDIFNGND